MPADSAHGVAPARLADATLAASYLTQVEDHIADGSVIDALNKLQDLVGGFADELAGDALALRDRYEAWRRQSRARKGAAADNINDIRADVLEVAYAAEQKARGSAPRGEIDPTGPGSSPQDRDPDQAPRSAPTAEQQRQIVFDKLWRKTESVVADVSGVRKRFKKFAFSLEPISFQLKLGEITGVVGRNASGKTTLLRILMGDLRPDEGRVTYPSINSGKPNWARIKRHIAYVPQSPVKWHGTLRHNLNFVAAVHAQKGQSVEDVSKRIDWCVARYGLTRYEHATWDEISGGYQTRFELVRALVSQPKLLVLDEPLAALDVIARERFLSDLRAIASALADPIPIIVTSQHLNEIEAVADQMILLDNGECRYAGSLAGIAEKAEHRFMEVSIDARRDEVALALEGLGLEHAETTMEGFILSFPKTVEIGEVFTRLNAAFGGKFSAIRDITGSARSLMSEAIT